MIVNKQLQKISEITNKDLSHLDNIFVVPVGEIAEHIGLQIEFISMPKGQSGKLEGRTIFINDDESATRNLFTIAHEIGHFILNFKKESPDSRNRFDDIKKYSKEELEEEMQANEFAANLLMPKEKFIEIYQKYKENLNDIAAFFGVSKVACQYRAINLGLTDSI